MKRWLFNIAAGASLLISLAALGLAVRSNSSSDSARSRWLGRDATVESREGRITINIRLTADYSYVEPVDWSSPSPRETRLLSYSSPAGPAYHATSPLFAWHTIAAAPPEPKHPLPGWRPTSGDTWLRVMFPHWMLILAFGLPVLIVIARRGLSIYRASKQYRLGLCPNCGYDLRATPDRCPECGAVIGLRFER